MQTDSFNNLIRHREHSEISEDFLPLSSIDAASENVAPHVRRPATGPGLPDRKAASRILVVDRDPVIAIEMTRHLGAYEIEHTADYSYALGKLDSGDPYDVLLMRWNQPDMSGYRMLAALSRAGITIPAIILIDDYCILYEETALSLGAVDVVVISRGARILARRIALAAKSTRSRTVCDDQEETFVFGRLTLRCESCRAYWCDQQIPLTLTEYRIVDVLAKDSPRCRSFREIYDVVHGEGFAAGDGFDGYRMNVRTLIKRIRRKFCTEAPDFAQIETVPGAGYRWRA